MKNRSDVVGGLLLFLMGVGAVVGAIHLKVGSPTEPQPGFFPLLGGLSLTAFSFIIFLKGWMAQNENEVAFGEVGRPALLLVVMIALVVVLGTVGYVIGTFIASGLILRIMNVRSWRVLLLTSLCLSVGTYILFDKLLGIDLPVGILARLGL